MVTNTMGNTFWSSDWIKGDAARIGLRNVNREERAPSDVKSKNDDVGKIQKTIKTLFF